MDENQNPNPSETVPTAENPAPVEAAPTIEGAPEAHPAPAAAPAPVDTSAAPVVDAPAAVIQDAAPVDSPPPQAEPESTLSFRAKALQSACESLREQIKTAAATNDQAGYHAAQNWLIEAERALRKAAAQCEQAEAVRLAVGEV